MLLKMSLSINIIHFLILHLLGFRRILFLQCLIRKYFLQIYLRTKDTNFKLNVLCLIACASNFFQNISSRFIYPFVARWFIMTSFIKVKLQKHKLYAENTCVLNIFFINQKPVPEYRWSHFNCDHTWPVTFVFIAIF